MFKELEYLVKLQKIDKQLLEINELKGDLPQIVNSLEKNIESLEDDLHNERNREKEIILEIKRLEEKIEDDKEHLKRYQDQLYLVTSNKEYDALTSEIDNVRQNIDWAEYKILELNEEMEKLKITIKNNDLTLQEKSEDIKNRREQLQKTNQKTDEAYAQLMSEREKIISHLSLRNIREYERIAKAKDRIAVVSVQQTFEEKVDKRGNIEYIAGQVSCGGCSKVVPPQKIVEIRAGNSLIRCEFCGRMLYWDEKDSEIRRSLEEEMY